MKFGLIGFNINSASRDEVVEIAQAAEAAGFESIWTYEHVIVPMDYESRHPYSASGKMDVLPETNMLDPLIALACVAATTESIRIGTGVNILPQCNPLLLAKQAASLDFLSNGRLMLGLGIGWLEEEYDALGVPFRNRGRRNDDYIEAMRKVWSGDVVEHESEFLSWHGFKSHPLPIQRPLPIIVGGAKGQALERVAKYAQGWYAPNLGIAELERLMGALQVACRAHNRDPAEIEVSTTWNPRSDSELLENYAAIGIDRLIAPTASLARPGASLASQIMQFGADLAQLSG